MAYVIRDIWDSRAEIGEGVRLGPKVEIECRRLVVGSGCTLGTHHPLRICGNEIVIKEGTYLGTDHHEMLIGGGGAGPGNPDSNLYMGRGTLFIGRTINLNRPVSFADDRSGASPFVDILTHGYAGPAWEGFPNRDGPVEIGRAVLLGWGSTVIGPCKIADNVIVGARSLVVSDLPEWTVCAGQPARPITNMRERRWAGDVPSRIASWIKEKNAEWIATLLHRGWIAPPVEQEGLVVRLGGSSFDFATATGSIGDCVIVDDKYGKYADDYRSFMRRLGPNFWPTNDVGRRWRTLVVNEVGDAGLRLPMEG